jgi:hypothetical protein
MRRLLLAATVGLITAGSSFAAPFTAGNLVVTRVGDGSAALGNTATAVFLDEYTTSGALVQSVALPTAAAGANNILTASGSATSEMGLTLSQDGRFLALAGYNAALGTAGVATGSSARTVGIVSVATGTVDTSTQLTGSLVTGNNIRTAYTTNGTNIYAGSAVGGVVNTTLGANGAPTQVSSTVTNVRRVNAFNGQLFTSTMSGAFRGVNTVGTGIPTTSGQTISLLNGFDPSTTSAESAYDFVFTNPSTLYVANDRTGANGGIQKWTLSGGTWTQAYVANPVTGAGLRGLTNVGNALYGIGTNGTIYGITDTGSGFSFNSIVTNGTNTAFRGIVALPTAVTSVPEAGSAALAGLGALPLIGAVIARRRRASKNA